MNVKLQEYYKDMRAMHRLMLVLLTELDMEIRSASNEKDMADIAYGLREIARFAEDIRKRSDKSRKFAERTACLLTIAITQSADPIHTDYCRASPKLRSILSVPKRNSDPEAYAKLMEHLKVPDHLWKGKDPILAPYWPGLVEYLGEAQFRGEQLPPGIDPNKTWPEYSLIIHGKQSPAGGEVMTHDDIMDDVEF